jgi:hypothetical protein
MTGGKMKDIQPEGEQFRKAIKWVSDMRSDDPTASLIKLIEQACFKFDLPPKEADSLMQFFMDQGAKRPE